MAASTLLGVDPPVLPVQVLVRSGELFGIAEGTTRVALSRMVAAGELVSEGDGRYALAGHLLARQRRQRESRRPRLRAWRGEAWRVAVVTAERRSAAERSAWRTVMRSARLGELREGVWARPDNVDVVVVEDVGGCEWATARFDDPVAVACRLWDLDGWSARARSLLRDLAEWTPRLSAGQRDALPPTFVLSAAVLRHFQADPLLPGPLLPAGWPGEELRAAYDEFDAAFVAVWRDWHGSFVVNG